LLIQTARRSLQILGYDDTAGLSITLVKDPAIKKMNRNYRGKDHATDVLSFTATPPNFPNVTKYLGDIVIGVDTAKRNAAADGNTLSYELVTLLVHGILHLSGYDHEHTSKKEAEKMMRKQKKMILEVLS